MLTTYLFQGTLVTEAEYLQFTGQVQPEVEVEVETEPETFYCHLETPITACS